VIKANLETHTAQGRYAFNILDPVFEFNPIRRKKMETMTKTDTLWDAYTHKFPTSLKRYREAVDTFPGGVTHDARYFKPFPIFMSHADGAYKWDLEGNRFIDYWMGHGALLLGHKHPAIVQAVTEQVQRGTHLGASQELELAWGQWVNRLVPSSERVCFTSSGTEATLLAIRLARGFTRKNSMIRFEGHFHGWHDSVTMGFKPPFDVPTSVGVPSNTWEHMKCLPFNDTDIVEKTLSEDPDIAGIIVEPAGGTSSTIPTQPGFLAALRELCDAYNVVLIFDEVVTGFRYAPGGAQEYFGVTPDMTTLGKIIGGGLPGAATVGRADIMELLSFQDDPEADRYERVAHPGTYNANPLSAAAGVAMLEIASTGEPQDYQASLTRKMIQGMNQILKAEQIPGCVYGDRAVFHLFVGQEICQPDDADRIIDVVPAQRLSAGMGPLGRALRGAFLLEGIDLVGGGRTSTAHTDADIEETLAAFERVIARLRRAELL
jgi:glutamate-1-semialdehyde 2,1-aminomutase